MNTQTVEHLLTQEVIKQRTPSVQYKFFNADRYVYEFQMGMADIRNGVPISDRSAYPVFSVTKTFTALSIVQLEALGLLRIDDPASRYIANFPYGKDITIKQLLCHSAGIPNPMPLPWIHLPDEHPQFDARKFFSEIFGRSKNVRTGRGHKFHYSNLGYVLLGELIEQVTGVSFEQYVTVNIFDKLNTEGDIGFKIPKGDQHVKGYHKRLSFSGLLLHFLINKYVGRREGIWELFHDFYVNGNSYGGIIATPRALVSYLQHLLNDDGLLVSKPYRLKLFEENYLSNGKPSGMCLSWFKGALRDTPYFAHAGGGGGFYCEVRLYPTRGAGSIIVFNRSGFSDERLLDTIDRFML